MVVILNDGAPEYIILYDGGDPKWWSSRVQYCTMAAILNGRDPEYILLYDGGDPKW